MSATALSYWAGPEGAAYISRNGVDEKNMAARSHCWRTIFEDIHAPYSVLEVGSNIGLNLRAMRNLLPPAVKYYAVEPNSMACDQMMENRNADVILNSSAFDINLSDKSVDVAFTAGVLIHIDPKDLLTACSEIHRVAARYIICVEYFSEQDVVQDYRGTFIHKCDYGKFWIDNFPDLRPLSAGFFWRNLTGLDNLNWWLFEKCQ